ncbi:MAG: hypothetical protein Fur0018_00010 [Anaerolineales bacterium]
MGDGGRGGLGIAQAEGVQPVAARHQEQGCALDIHIVHPIAQCDFAHQSGGNTGRLIVNLKDGHGRQVNGIIQPCHRAGLSLHAVILPEKPDPSGGFMNPPDGVLQPAHNLRLIRRQHLGKDLVDAQLFLYARRAPPESAISRIKNAPNRL